MSEWSGLKKEEIKILIGKYSKIVRSLRCEYAKRNNVYKIDVNLPDGLQLMSLNVLTVISINDDVLKKDTLRLLESFYRYYDWGNTHGAYTNELLSLCVATEVLNYWEIQYDLDNLLDMLDLDKSSYDGLYFKVNQFAKLNYWNSDL